MDDIPIHSLLLRFKECIQISVWYPNKRGTLYKQV